MPAQEGVRCHECLQIPQGLSTKRLGLCGQSSSLRIGETEPATAELFPEDAILLLEIVDDVTLLLVHPTSECQDEELKHLRIRRHVGERSRGSRWSRTLPCGEFPA